AEPLGVPPAGDLAAELDVVLVLAALPHVAHGDGGDALPVLREPRDEVDVGLGPAAAAEERDADRVVAAGDLGVAGGGQGQGRGGPEELAAVERRGRLGHGSARGGRDVSPGRAGSTSSTRQRAGWFHHILRAGFGSTKS